MLKVELIRYWPALIAYAVSTSTINIWLAVLGSDTFARPRALLN